MFRRLDRRERLVVTAGVAVSVAALLVTFVVVPQVRRWSEREARITLRTEQLARLRAVVAQEAPLREVLGVLERERAAAERRLLPGGTMAVAGSNLQVLLNRYATEAGMEVERVDAVTGAADDMALPQVPARLTVRGDIRSLVELLWRIQDGETLLAVDELSVSANAGRQGNEGGLSATLGLHGYALGPGGSP